MSVEKSVERWASTDSEPIQRWFGLSYCSYLVVQRTFLQSMPLEWQQRFVACLEELDSQVNALPNVRGNYTAVVKGEDGKITKDPYRDYERGRRRVFDFSAQPSLAESEAQ